MRITGAYLRTLLYVYVIVKCMSCILSSVSVCDFCLFVSDMWGAMCEKVGASDRRV